MKLRSSRRAVGLKPSDYDHEISLIDNDATVSPHNGHHYVQMDYTTTKSTLPRSSHDNGGGESDTSNSQRPDGPSGSCDMTPERTEHQKTQETVRQSPCAPSVQTHAATSMHESRQYSNPQKNAGARETAIDILYENQRGGILCGAALFSSRALGGLDAAPWTNEFHKPSLTNIYTAVVSDPTWEWFWPEWRVNHQEGVDKFGWEYSFAFSSAFSWHGAKWWNSFVRRRAWIRRRVKKHCDHRPNEPHILTSDYFSIRAASERAPTTRAGSLISRAPSRRSSLLIVPQRPSTINLGGAYEDDDDDYEQPDIVDIASLMRQLRAARIDREKGEAVENYLRHARDLVHMQRAMHDIMGLFVFQASRRLLLCHLVARYNDAADDAASDPENPAKRDRRNALNAALRHADEEVRKLAYWSDVKHMVASGESRIGLNDDRHQFYETFQGIDQSGPAPPNRGRLPGKS